MVGIKNCNAVVGSCLGQTDREQKPGTSANTVQIQIEQH